MIEERLIEVNGGAGIGDVEVTENEGRVQSTRSLLAGCRLRVREFEPAARPRVRPVP